MQFLHLHSCDRCFFPSGFFQDILISDFYSLYIICLVVVSGFGGGFVCLLLAFILLGVL